MFKAVGKRRKWKFFFCCCESRGMKGERGGGEGRKGETQSEPTGQQSMNALGDGAVGRRVYMSEPLQSNWLQM